jgi:TrpR-related protein YerC/YecD
MAKKLKSRHVWATEEMVELFEAMWSMKTRAELEDFLRDLCTLQELETFAHRWQVAKLVNEGLPYLEIAQRTGASTATVTRVANWLLRGEGGYEMALLRTSSGSPSLSRDVSVTRRSSS